jgi:hypothetical protein
MKKLLFILIPVFFMTAVSCKKSTPVEDPIPYTTYTVKSATKTLKHASNFAKDFCSTSTFCCRFTATADTTDAETVKFGIPGDPIVGYVYYSGLYRFSCFYVDPSGIRYDLTNNPSSLFSVVFTQWDGQGGWAKGHFSGWMKSPENDSILFQNGYFQNKIWTIGTK